MNIVDLFNKKLILLDLKATDKDSLIDELIDALEQNGNLNDRKEFKKAILNREAQSSTGISDGIAIPHAKSKSVKVPSVVFGRSKRGIDYNALDEKDSHLFFMIAVDDNAKDDHLKMLAHLSTKLMDETFRESLLKAKNENEVISLLQNQPTTETTTSFKSNKKILAVTACPTGIAHTFMAADNLKKAAKELGYEIKVETNGATGVENRLTEKEIEEADGIILAVGKTVETNRFNGKRVIQVPVTDAIKKPKELIEKSVNESAPVFVSAEQSSASDKNNQTNQKGSFYRHVMNGVSEMLPFVICGGILIAISFLFGHKSFDKSDPSYNAFAAMIFEIGAKNAFALMIPILAAFIGRSIADKPGFVAGMVGGSLAALGGSGFLGGIIAGFLAGYVAIGVKKVLSKTPKWLDSIKAVLIFPLVNVFLTGAIMYTVINKPLASFNTSLTHWLQDLGSSNAIILGLILGAMMAIDMGGPINKAAYVFATGLLANHLYEPMAAVMAAGMVPPLGVALATVLFKNRFTSEEREAGKTAMVLGSFFITEGAIPFAAADPSRVIPSLVIGSAVAGALSMAFGLGLTTSHGGIIVFGLVQGGWLKYVFSILIGSIVTAISLGILKKKI